MGSPTFFLRLVLRPLAALSLRRGVRVQEFFEQAKLAFIDAAQAELETSTAVQSTSRLAAMTGLQRKELKRLLGTKPEQPRTPHFLAKLLGQWSTDKRYLDKRGSPRELAIDNEFSELVSSNSKDLSPYTALFELERVGAVKRIESRVRLVQSVFEISADQNAAMAILAQDIEGLVSAVSTNIFGMPPVPELHARTHFDNIAPSTLPRIRKWLLERGSRFHTEVRTLLSQCDKDLNPTLDPLKRGVTVSVGTFSAVSEEVRDLGKKTLQNKV